MRHRNSGRKLNITGSHKRAMFRNLANSLISSGIVKTTLPKAKELRSFIEPLITLSKVDSLPAKRLAYDRLRSRDSVSKLFSEIGPKSIARAGGYTRIIKAGFRSGDASPMAYIELVDRDA